jgi:thioredoxin-related protein
MKVLLLILVSSLALSSPKWLNNFVDAKKIAAEKHEVILLNFSGSDWCGPCMRLRKEIFESEAFKEFSDSNLVLVNADFPRLKKNQLNKDQTKQNEALADKYNPKGKFPFTLLLNEEGKILKTYDGFPDISAAAFTNEIKAVCNAAK